MSFLKKVSQLMKRQPFVYHTVVSAKEYFHTLKNVSKANWKNGLCASKENPDAKNQKPFFVYCHVPKTAGSTFLSILRQNFAPRFEAFITGWIYQYPPIQCQQILSYTEDYPLLMASSSHVFRINQIPYQCKDRRFIAICHIRNPVDRYLSSYFYFRNDNQAAQPHYPEAHYDLDEYIDRKIGTRHSLWNDLFDSSMNPNHGTVSFDEATSYLKNLIENKHLYLFTTEEFDFSLNYLNQQFPEYFVNIEYTHQNVSEKTEQVTEQQRQKISQQIPEAEWELYRLAVQTGERCAANFNKK